MNEILRQSPVLDNLDPFGGSPANWSLADEPEPTDEQLEEIENDPEYIAWLSQLDAASRE